jgi:hypothetical protein
MLHPSTLISYFCVTHFRTILNAFMCFEEFKYHNGSSPMAVAVFEGLQLFVEKFPELYDPIYK